MNNVVDMENLRVDLSLHFQRVQAIDFWGKAFRKNTMAAEGCIDENSTYIRKQMGKRETEIEREEREQRQKERVAKILYIQGWTNFLHAPANLSVC